VAEFPPTSQSILHDLRSDDERIKARARERLAAQYWTPIYTYVRFRWRLAPDRAAELTQELFLKDLERETFTRFDPDRARFRTFLRTCVDNLMRDQARYDRAGKRHSEHVVAFELAEQELARLDSSLSPDEAFEQAWRKSVVTAARARLDENLRNRGKHQHAEIFAMFHDEDPPPSYADAAARLQITITDVTNWLHLARREWRTQFSLVLYEGGISQEDLATELASQAAS
jgi:RNA polymerase sigma factor (sigma-70 family)